MNDDREDNNSWCYFHPKETVVGVCALCLNERLLVLAAKQGGRHNHHRLRHRRTHSSSGERIIPNIQSSKPKPPIHLPNLFALGSVLLHRLEFRHWKSDNHDDDDHDYASTSQEDSFISIKFEDNGVASWDKSTVSKVSLEHCMSWNHHTLSKENATTTTTTKHTTNNNKKSVIIEHTKPRAVSLRWRKRIGHLFQLIRWKRSNKGSVCHVGTKVEGVKVRKGWIRTLTKRRTKE